MKRGMRLVLFLVFATPFLVFSQDRLFVEAATDVISTIDSSKSEVIEAVNEVRETPDKGLEFWLDYIILIVMPLSVKLITRLTRIRSRFNFLFKAFKGMDTLAVVSILSLFVSGIADLFEIKFFIFDSLGDYFALAFVGSMMIYEATKKLLGKTPKVEALEA